MKFTAIRASVSPDTINRVGRLFNNTLEDVLGELLQNARRAGATRIEIERSTEGGAKLAVIDDGIGIADPAAIITLGDSQWDATIAAREDPAGMGIFSLAGHDVTITSRHASHSEGWSATIACDAWDGSRDVLVQAAERGLGTTFEITLPGAWGVAVDRLVASAALNYPLPVFYNGVECPREPWLNKAIHTSSWNGCTMGVFAGSNYYRNHILNFHGVTVPCKLPSIAEMQGGSSYYARIDIHDCPAIQLVLPTRKEAVENDALALLREAVERALYEAVAAKPAHSLAFTHWARAKELGIELREAVACLHRWTPSTADSSSDTATTELIPAHDVIRLERYEPEVEQSIGRALRASPLKGQMVDCEDAFQGYDWYDRLTTMNNVRFEVAHETGDLIVESAETTPALTDHLAANAITMRADLYDGSRTYRISADTDVAFATNADLWSGLDAARIIYSPSLAPDDLADLLEAAYFQASDDSACDSWDTQRRAFQSDAREMALKLLRGPDEALRDKFRSLMQENRWMVPKGTAVHIELGDDIDVRLERSSEQPS